MGSSGLEPPTSRLSGVRSNRLSYEPPYSAFGRLRFACRSCFQLTGGDERDRTADPLLARQVLSQLSYTPIFFARAVFPSTCTVLFALYSPKQKRAHPTGCCHFCFLEKNPALPSKTLARVRALFCGIFIPFLLHLRKEVIQPHLPIRLPCYDFTPVIDLTFDSCLHKWLAHWLRALPTSVV